jgi:hypothetical protein
MRGIATLTPNEAKPQTEDNHEWTRMNTKVADRLGSIIRVHSCAFVVQNLGRANFFL